ncbi:hypothetical protein ACFW1P_14010 [Paenibacillus sp. NPDC058910]|uniref:hypothetical protein n=1 Tax=unclassified Paenibacillus TaxID=185978 RepID=UPI0036C0C1E8
MRFCLHHGDTNFIALVNADKYKTFVDEDWEFESLFKHFSDEMEEGKILVFQMTEEGIEHSWTIEVKFEATLNDLECYRRTEGYIEVTDNKLYIVDYDCLTMAAQFSDNKIPDENCANNRIELKNGMYMVEIVQFYNADNDEHIGGDKINMLMNFNEISNFEANADKVIWCSYI